MGSMGFGAPIDPSRNIHWVQPAIWRFQPWKTGMPSWRYGKPGHEAIYQGIPREISWTWKHWSKMTPRCNQWPCTINAKEMDVDVACVTSLPALPPAESTSLLRMGFHGITTMDYDDPQYVVGISSVQPPITINQKGFVEICSLACGIFMDG